MPIDFRSSIDRKKLEKSLSIAEERHWTALQDIVFNLVVKKIAEIMVEELTDLSPLNELGVYQ